MQHIFWKYFLLFIHTYRIEEHYRSIKNLTKFPSKDNFLCNPQIFLLAYVGYFSNNDLKFIKTVTAHSFYYRNFMCLKTGFEPDFLCYEL